MKYQLENATWRPLTHEFREALTIVSRCACRSLYEPFALACMHVTPNWIETTNNQLIARYHLKTGLSERCIYVPHLLDVLKWTSTSIELATVENETCFRNPDSGEQLAVPNQPIKFPNCSPFLTTQSEPSELQSEDLKYFIKDRKLRKVLKGKSLNYTLQRMAVSDGTPLVVHITASNLIISVIT